MPESAGNAANHPWRIFARVFSGADGGQECPADTEADSSTNPRSYRSTSSSARSDVTLQGLRDDDRKTLDVIGDDFKRVGLPDWVTQRVEDLIIDHFYRIESDLFHVEHELKACLQDAQAQQLENRSLAKRIFHVEEELRALRHGGVEPDGLQKACESPATSHCGDPDSTRESVSTVASTAFTAARAATLSAHSELLEQLRRDFDAQAKYHEARFASVQHSLSQCCSVLQALGGELTSPTSFSQEEVAEESTWEDPVVLLKERPGTVSRDLGKTPPVQAERQPCLLSSQQSFDTDRSGKAAGNQLHNAFSTNILVMMPAASHDS